MEEELIHVGQIKSTNEEIEVLQLIQESHFIGIDTLVVVATLKDMEIIENRFGTTSEVGFIRGTCTAEQRAERFKYPVVVGTIPILGSGYNLGRFSRLIFFRCDNKKRGKQYLIENWKGHQLRKKEWWNVGDSERKSVHS